MGKELTKNYHNRSLLRPILPISIVRPTMISSVPRMWYTTLAAFSSEEFESFVDTVQTVDARNVVFSEYQKALMMANTANNV